jgi:hypothetical protein
LRAWSRCVAGAIEGARRRLSSDPSWMHPGGRFRARCDGHFRSCRGVLWAPCEGGMRARSRVFRDAMEGRADAFGRCVQAACGGSFRRVAWVILGACRGLLCAHAKRVLRRPLERARTPSSDRSWLCPRGRFGVLREGHFGSLSRRVVSAVEGALRRRRRADVAPSKRPLLAVCGDSFRAGVDEVAAWPLRRRLERSHDYFSSSLIGGIEGSPLCRLGTPARPVSDPDRGARAAASRAL